jgi:hypothetical protein
MTAGCRPQDVSGEPKDERGPDVRDGDGWSAGGSHDIADGIPRLSQRQVRGAVMWCGVVCGVVLFHDDPHRCLQVERSDSGSERDAGQSHHDRVDCRVVVEHRVGMHREVHRGGQHVRTAVRRGGSKQRAAAQQGALASGAQLAATNAAATIPFDVIAGVIIPRVLQGDHRGVGRRDQAGVRRPEQAAGAATGAGMNQLLSDRTYARSPYGVIWYGMATLTC